MREAWEGLDADVGLVILTAAAAASLGAAAGSGPLTVILP